MIVPMERVLVAGPHSLLEPCLKLLHKAGTIHITNSRHDPLLNGAGLSTGRLGKDAEDRLERGEALLFDVTSALALLQQAQPERHDLLAFEPGSEDWLSDEFAAGTSSICAEIFSAASKSRQIGDELRQIRAYRRMFEEFRPLVETVTTMRSVQASGFVLRENVEQARNEIEEALATVTGGSHLIFTTEGGEGFTALLLVYPAWLENGVQSGVFDPLAGKIHTISLPEEYERNTFAGTLKALFDREAEAEAEHGRLEERMREYGVRFTALLRTAAKGLDWTLRRLKMHNFLAHSERAFWISGWIPGRDAEALKNRFDGHFGGAAFAITSEPLPEEYPEVPVLLENRPWAKPFELLLRFYPPPVYGSVDPTPLLAVFFPLFFGLILGDTGYALVLFALAAFHRMRRAGMPLWNEITSVLFACAATSFIFGIIFGEFFGKLWFSIGLPPPLFDRKHEIIPTLLAALALGVAHLSIGNMVGGFSHLSKRRWRHGVINLIDLSIILSSAFLAYIVISGRPFQPWHASFLAVALISKIAVGGVREALEIAKLLSNMLSYARLMALGLASIMLADVADDFYSMGDGAAWGVMAAVALHIVNFGLGMISPAIQSLRLHYVEFFGQFYTMGAIRYLPFRAT